MRDLIPMNPRHITPQYERAAAWFRPRVLPWRRLTIAIDGVDGAGKSSFARFLAWQLGMTVIEADLVLAPDCTVPRHDLQLLGRLLHDRLDDNRPVIVEGVFIQRALRQIGIVPDYVALVRAIGHRGSLTWQTAYKIYRREHPSMKTPDYKLVWRPEEGD